MLFTKLQVLPGVLTVRTETKGRGPLHARATIASWKWGVGKSLHPAMGGVRWCNFWKHEVSEMSFPVFWQSPRIDVHGQGSGQCFPSTVLPCLAKNLFISPFVHIGEFQGVACIIFSKGQTGLPLKVNNCGLLFSNIKVNNGLPWFTFTDSTTLFPPMFTVSGTHLPFER